MQMDQIRKYFVILSFQSVSHLFDMQIQGLRKRNKKVVLFVSEPVANDQGKSIEDIDAEVWKRWRSDVDWAPDGGESLATLSVRVSEACEDIAEISKERAVVVVTHVSPIKAALAWVLGLDAGVSWKCHVSPGSSMMIKMGEYGPVLQNFNLVE